MKLAVLFLTVVLVVLSASAQAKTIRISNSESETDTLLQVLEEVGFESSSVISRDGHELVWLRLENFWCEKRVEFQRHEYNLDGSPYVYYQCGADNAHLKPNPQAAGVAYNLFVLNDLKPRTRRLGIHSVEEIKASEVFCWVKRGAAPDAVEKDGFCQITP